MTGCVFGGSCFKAAFHDTDILARIHPRENVGVGVVECGLYGIR